MPYSIVGDLSVLRNMTVLNTATSTTPTAGDNSTYIATTAYVTNAVSSLTGGSGSLTATASGSISAGSPVALNSDGTVSQVVQLAYSTTPGTPVGFTSTYRNNGGNPIVVYITNSKVVVTYGSNIVVGTVSGTTISFGAPVTIPSTATALVYNSTDNVVVLAYSTYVVVGTVSGTTVSLGTAVNTTLTVFAMSYVVSSHTVVITDGVTAVVGTVSGTNHCSNPICYYSGWYCIRYQHIIRVRGNYSVNFRP